MKLLRRGKIAFRLTVVMVLLCLVPVGIVTVYFDQYYSQGVESRAIENNYKLLNIVDNVASEEMNKIRYLSDVLAMSQVVQQHLTGDDAQQTFGRDEVLQLNSEIDEMYAISTMIKSICVFSLEGKSLFRTGYHFLTDEEHASYVEKVEQRAPLEYITAGFISQGNDCVLVFRAINSSETYNKRLGYLVITINEDVFSKKVFDGVERSQGDILFAYSPDEVIATSNAADFAVGSMLPETVKTHIRQARQQGSRHFVIQHQNAEYIGSFRYNTQIGWTEVLLADQRATVTEKEQMRGNILLVALLCGLASALCVVVVSRTISLPLKNIVSFVHKSEKGQPAELTDPAQDEIGYLARHTQKMVIQLKQMEQQRLQAAEERRIQELLLLQAQISPHFLFNILNNFKWIAALNEVPALEQGISDLALLLRSTIMRTDEMIPLCVEIDNLYRYFRIQTLIEPGRLLFEEQIDPEVKQTQVPKLLLQPLMENSILHGLRPTGEVLHIRLTACREEGACRVVLSDDGAGCEENSAQPKGERAKMNHIGVENIRQRVELSYQGRARFLFESKVGQGTKVTIVVPLEKGEIKDV